MRSLELLYALGAIDDDAKLTEGVGQQLADFPCHPRLSKMLLQSLEEGCAEEALSVAAMLNVQQVFMMPKGKAAKEEALGAWKELAVAEGDHYTLVNVYRTFMEEDRSARRDWCDANAINFRTISRAVEVRGQLRHYLRQFKQTGVVLASCGQDVDALGRAILAGYFSNVARLQPDGNYRTARDDRLVYVDSSSILARFGGQMRCGRPADWVVYNDVRLQSVRTSGYVGGRTVQREHIREVSIINPMWLRDVAPHYYEVRGPASEGGAAGEGGDALVVRPTREELGRHRRKDDEEASRRRRKRAMEGVSSDRDQARAKLQVGRERREERRERREGWRERREERGEKREERKETREERREKYRAVFCGVVRCVMLCYVVLCCALYMCVVCFVRRRTCTC